MTTRDSGHVGVSHVCATHKNWASTVGEHHREVDEYPTRDVHRSRTPDTMVDVVRALLVSVERVGEADQGRHVVRPFEGGRVRDVTLADAALELCHRLEA
jgi:hypothetical protein